MSPSAVTEELGHRLKQARLNTNLTQAEVALKAGMTRRAVLEAEKGKVQLEKFVAILLALNMGDQLNTFLPVQEISPLQLVKLKGRQRQRASKPKKNPETDENNPSW